MTYDLVRADDPILHRPTLSFPFEHEDADKIASSMLDVMIDNNGVGLAANQVGMPWSMFVLDSVQKAIFNPQIIDFGGDEILELEGCLTYPGLRVKIKRHQRITIRFQDSAGVVREETFSDLAARIVQHEIGHLQGKIFYNAAVRFHRDAALKKWRAK